RPPAGGLVAARYFLLKGRKRCPRDPPGQLEYRSRKAKPDNYPWSPDGPFPQKPLTLAKARGSFSQMRRPLEKNFPRQRELRVDVFPAKPVASLSLDPRRLPSSYSITLNTNSERQT